MSGPFDRQRPAAGAFTATSFYVGLLAGLSALGQFASNIVTPSLPAAAQALAVGPGQIQWVMSVFLASFAVAQLIHGPLSDRFGRRRVLFAGLGLFLAGSGVAGTAGDLATLLAGRALQAFGAGAGIVIARAVIRDVFDGVEMTRVLALVTMVFGLVPGLTPLAGGIVQDGAGWRTAYAVAAAAGIGLALLAMRRLPETNPQPDPSLAWRHVAGTYGRVFGHGGFMRYALTVALVFASMSAFFAGSPAVFIAELGVSPTEYGLYPPLAVTGFFLGGMTTRRLSGRVAPARLALTGLALMAVSAVAMAGTLQAVLVHKHVINAAMIMHVTGLGIFLPTAMGAALAHFPTHAGTAAAALGFLQMAGGALGTVAAGHLAPHLPVLAFPSVMAASATLACLLFGLSGLGVRNRRAPAA